jgi:polyisoprenyl-teichoic acid--peptidoglycan teichoic acid transferase
MIRFFSLLIGLLLLSALAACGPAAQISAPPPTAASLAVGQRPSATPLPVPESGETPVPAPTVPAPADPLTAIPTVTGTITAAPTATSTLIPTATPTSRPQFDPTLDATVAVGFLREGEPTPSTPIPTAVPTFEVPRGITNILLLGSDNPIGDEISGRTDTLIIVSINPAGPTAAMISLPRDLYVYVPGYTMNRINTVLARGDSTDYAGGGIGLLKQTILYNFGIPIHYYAQVDFQGFENIVDALGGVELAVSCERTDWRLISPELDPQEEENWEVFTLPVGIHQLDGDLALWYARSRLLDPLADWSRNRRQQQLLRAMFNQGVDLNLVAEFPTLWNAYKDSVETDLDIGKLLQLATLAPSVRQNGIQNLYLAGKTQSWVTPGGGAVQLPVWEGPGMMHDTFRRLFRPPDLNRATRPPIYVEVINATDRPDMALLAADNLAWYGFVPVIGPAEPQAGATTTLSYYKPNFKESYDWLISWIFNVPRGRITLASDSDYPYDYRVVVGEDYNPCRPQLYAPQAFLED